MLARYQFGDALPARGDPARSLRRDVGRRRAARPGDRRSARSGSRPCAIRIGIVGAPRVDKLVQAVLDGVAACARDDVQLVCWSLGPGDAVPDDPRIAIAEPYRGCDAATYATRLAACDALALVFDPDGDMLATGTAADAQGVGLPALDLGLGVPDRDARRRRDPVRPHRGVDRGRARRAHRRSSSRPRPRPRSRGGPTYDWEPIAARTADLFDRVVLDEP